MNKIFSYLPETIKRPLRGFRNKVKYHGSARFCPVCEQSSGSFKSYGVHPRRDAVCPRCGALERHRLLWLFLEKKTNFFNNERSRTMLHVAPEPVLESKFRGAIGAGYLTADLYNPLAMVEMDITNIDFPDGSFDVIYCSHVLEHVQNDQSAMREFYRVLKVDGWAILLVPIIADKTFEDPSITAPKERERVFGQYDHVRNYGPDYIDRLRTAGFSVEKTEAGDLVNFEQAKLMGLTNASGDIFFCTK